MLYFFLLMMFIFARSVSEVIQNKIYKMIPPIPMTPPATHVEHFCPAIHLRQMKIRRLLRVPFPFESARSTSAPRQISSRLLTAQELSRLLAIYPILPNYLPRPPYARLGGVAEYYRGNDLRYAANVNAPPALRVENTAQGPPVENQPLQNEINSDNNNNIHMQNQEHIQNNQELIDNQQLSADQNQSFAGTKSTPITNQQK